jgi:hypothetical protein
LATTTRLSSSAATITIAWHSSFVGSEITACDVFRFLSLKNVFSRETQNREPSQKDHGHHLSGVTAIIPLLNIEILLSFYLLIFRGRRN